jgi:hypothetical protein
MNFKNHITCHNLKPFKMDDTNSVLYFFMSGVVFGISEFWASMRDLHSEGEEGAMKFLSVGGRAEAAATKEIMCFSLKL